MIDLERSLVQVGRELDVPTARDVVPAVLERIERRPTRGRAARWVPQRRLLVAAAVVLLAALAATLAVPDARSALFRVLHIGGATVELVDKLPPTQPSLVESILGERVSLSEARRRAGFRLRELDEPPDRVYVLDPRPTVWFVYGTQDAPRLLVAQSPGLAVDQRLFKKLVTSETTIEDVSIDGGPGYFVSGTPHAVLLVDEFGNVVDDSTRLAGNVLLWEVGGVAYRLEGDFTKREAVELAESLR